MKIYWAENTNARGGRFIIAKSKESAFNIGIKIGMVRDQRNLQIKEADEDLHLNSNINEIKEEGLAGILSLKDNYRVWGVF